MDFLIIGDPLNVLKPTGDTSLALARAAMKRQHSVFWATDDDVAYSQNGVRVRHAQLAPFEKDGLPESVEVSEPEPLSRFNAVFIRKNPPFDHTYNRLCWLLELEEEKTYFMNAPAILMRYHEKLVPLEAVSTGFLKPDDVIPTFIGDIAGAQRWVQKHQPPKIVVKPFLGFAGQEVVLMSREEFISASPQDSRFHQRIVQPFEPAIAHGDRRVFFLDGKIIGHFVRVPAPGGFISNLAQGGTAVERPIPEEEFLVLQRLGKFLKAKGIHLAGADVFGNKISEVNITSPTGLRQIEALYDHDCGEEIIAFAEKCAFYGRT